MSSIRQETELQNINKTSIDTLAQEKLADTVSKIMHELETQTEVGKLKINIDGVELMANNITYANRKPTFDCAEGSININNACGRLHNFITFYSFNHRKVCNDRLVGILDCMTGVIS